MRIELILYPILGFTLAIIIFYYMKKGYADDEQSKVIDAMKLIAQSMNSGDSFETAMTKVDSKYFKRVIEQTNSGKELEVAMIDAAGKDMTLKYIAEVLSLTFTSKGNIINSLNRLSNKLWEINHLEKKIDSKASAAISTLQVMGIAIMPAIFYFLAGILTTPEWVIDVDTVMKMYLGFMMFVFTMLNFIVFNDIKGSGIVLPFSITLYITYIISLGPVLYGVLL